MVSTPADDATPDRTHRPDATPEGADRRVEAAQSHPTQPIGTHPTIPVTKEGDGGLSRANLGVAREDVEALRRASAAVSEVVVGQQDMVDRMLIALLAKGHVLLEGVPGVAKTLAARTFATVLGGSFARLQFTPDLVPSDIVGTRIYRPSSEVFDIELGPVFVNFVLADEINRAPAKVQAAMLELMAEKQVSLSGKSFPLPSPFTVFATQNPLESEGVYPLPEAQRDRFLMKVDVPLPGPLEETEILRRMSFHPPAAHQVLDSERVMRLQNAAEQIYVHPLLADYIVRLVMATRQPREFGLPGIEPLIDAGVSPRASLGLVASSRALALLNDRDHVLPEDIQALAGDVMAHRLVLGFDAVADGIRARDIVNEVVRVTPAPRPA